MQRNNVLVSVVIVTYNSSSTIIETIDSVYAQTYDNIELIISDDSSTDDTVNKCKKWIDTHGKRFHTCKIIESEKNTGVAPNANRGLKQCHGEWIKVLGGDDLFLPNAVEEMLKFATPDKDVIVTQYRDFKIENGNKTLLGIHPSRELDRFYISEAAQQNELIPRVFIEATIGYFIRKSVIDTLGGYNERYPMNEDTPLFLKISDRGYKFYLLKKVCFLYRIGESITHPHRNNIYNIRFKESSLRFDREVLNKRIPWWDILYHQKYWMEYFQFILIINIAKNKRGFTSHIIQTFFHYTTLDYYASILRRAINKLQ